MNLGQLRAAVLNQTGLDTNDGLVTLAAINAALVRAQHAYEAEGTWPWLQAAESIALVASTDTYTPGAGTSPINFPVGSFWSRTSEIRTDTGVVVEWFSPTELDDRWSNTQIGKPIEFSIYADQIVVRPIPSQSWTYLHRFERSEVDMTADSDSPALPAEYHEALVDYASYLMFRRSRETERMQEAQANYKAWIVKMRSRALRRADLPGKVRVRPNGWLG